MFQISHDKQIQKLSLGVQFDQEFMEKTWETYCCRPTETYCTTHFAFKSFFACKVGSQISWDRQFDSINQYKANKPKWLISCV